VIETSSDVDVYQITTNGGSVDIQVLAAEVRPMLDPQLALRDSSNNNIAVSTTNTGSDGIGEKIHINQLNAGTYYIVIGGSGTYGDMGQYRLNVVTSLNGTANNDSLSTATGVGVFGQTDAGSVAIGLGGTAVINDSLFGLDSVDYFKFRVPANTSRIFVSVDPNNNNDAIVLYDDFNGNGVIDAGETLAGTKSMSTPQSFTFNLASGYETYYVRVSGGGSFNFGAYQLRIAVDAARDSLPPSVASAGFDPQPLVVDVRSMTRSTFPPAIPLITTALKQIPPDFSPSISTLMMGIRGWTSAQTPTATACLTPARSSPPAP
jgi:hypothetical protein